MTTSLAVMSQKLAERFGMGAGRDVVDVLKATAFKGSATDAQMTALMIVANQYSLNPFTKEIYAFPDKNNGIVPVVGVDGWARIINSHSQFDGMDFEQDAESCTCIIYRKDRSHPVRVTEFLAECKRGTGPWQSHPRRMLRHKAMIQAARLAFGFVGIYEQDEAERILESDTVQARHEPEMYPPEDFETNLPAWQAAISSGKRTADEIIAIVESRGALTDQQREAIHQAEIVDAEVVDVEVVKQGETV